MDSSVLAALISVPVALLASAAAYAAGRAQASGAYRGPVAAVRRQHQREAYAALLTAANTYTELTEWGACLTEARFHLGVDAVFGDRAEEVTRRAARVRADVPVEPVRAAASVVLLEGPDHIAELAKNIELIAQQVRSDARAGRGGPAEALSALAEERDWQVPARYNLIKAVEAFTAAARGHLNGGDLPA
ncbi:hypothetical protein ACFVIY_06850 [Streptomyces sp. NPDC127166]|uniref:hypothetical protein n=1 Tax=Streptomyces sp. NPDC127166 TaxID=3345380 RepID=UPI003628BF9B